MSLLNTNKLTFFKNEGKPLQLGYVYVGEPQLDPQVPANQKTVTFTDSQGNSFPATQPIRTDNDGRVQWNGKAIEATVDGDYSLLLLDSNQTEINGGWTPLVTSTTSNGGDLTNYREYGLLLADIKKLDVSPGMTVGNVGKTATNDTEGTSWFVVSPVGTADDIDLIDFDNGLQGQRVRGGGLPAISGYTKSEGFYIKSDAVLSPKLIVSSDLPVGFFHSIGPTLAGADYPWAALDVLPSYATHIEILVRCFSANAGGGSAVTTLEVRPNGSIDTANLPTANANISNTGATSQFITWSTIKCPVDNNGIFEAIWKAVSGTSNTVEIYLVGFGV